MKKIIIIILIIFLIGCQKESVEAINNFEECIAAGNPAMESYPRQCRAGERTFTEEILEELPTVEDVIKQGGIVNSVVEESVEEPVGKKGITRIELEKHNIENDCWIAFEEMVYDVTDYLGNHPGGKDVLIKHCGTEEDFTRAFTSKHGRSKIQKLMDEGELKGELI